MKKTKNAVAVVFRICVKNHKVVEECVLLGGEFFSSCFIALPTKLIDIRARHKTVFVQYPSG
jgi:hypothetical protein